MAVSAIDLHEGGAYRYVWRNTQGTVMVRVGVYRELVRPEKIVATEVFDESWYPGEALDTTLLVERGGKTTLTITVLYESREARDIALRSGMEQGMAAGYDRLADLLAQS
jgi:uncharacterized protein YndB with AHSA1/START domain